MALSSVTHTQRNENRDFVEWHRGRAPYVFWAIDVDCPAVRARVDHARGAIDDLLLKGYVRQPHVTLDLCGFPAARPSWPDEFSPDFVDRQCQALAGLGLRDFDIRVGGLSSFASAPYLEVFDPSGAISAVRNALALGMTPRLSGRYVPHVTVGLYSDAWPAPDVLARLQTVGSLPELSFSVRGISLMSYQPASIGGLLDRVGYFCLVSGRMHEAADYRQGGYLSHD